MVKALKHSLKSDQQIAIGNFCHSCDLKFNSEEDFKEHILTTIHNGPAEATRNFKFRLTEKIAKSNIIKGAKKSNLNIEYKQGATNIDFSDGTWILAAFPEQGEGR